MRCSRAVVAVLFTFGSACADAPEPNLTSPASPPAPRFTVSAPCDLVTRDRVRSEIGALFKDSEAPNFDLNHANQRWARVEAACSNLSSLPNAADSMMAYVKFTIEVFKAGRVLQPAASLVGHWNSTFAYVGYDPPNLGANVLGAEGAVGVVPAGNLPAVGQEIRAANAALTMFTQDANGGDRRAHLFAIAPLPNNCLGATNLARTGPCFEFSSFPKANPKFSPAVKVGVCQPVEEGAALAGRAPALGHLSGTTLEVPEQAAYPTFCSFTASPPPAISWNSGVSGVARRVAWFATKLLGPEPLYAVHGGLGGLGDDLSPFGGVDLMVFEASLGDVTPGATPGSPNAGTWFSQITKPGKIYTQLGLGNYREKIIVINQGGGNCGPKCGGILLQANLSDQGTAGATSGRYDVSWVSVQDKPVVKAAPFILRGAGGEIAKLEYRTNSGRRELYYNDRLVGNWIRQVPQRFVIRVDFASTPRTTSLWFGALDATPNFAQPVPFLNNAATSLSQFAADFRGTDSGVMGWAEIAVQRIPDR